jgi:putative transposase
MVLDGESEAFWSEFIDSLRERGLSVVHVVFSDADTGLTNLNHQMF